MPRRHDAQLVVRLPAGVRRAFAISAAREGLLESELLRRMIVAHLHVTAKDLDGADLGGGAIEKNPKQTRDGQA
jgi:hypothetical protein